MDAAAPWRGVKFQRLDAGRIDQIVKRHLPIGWTVVQSRHRSRLPSGEANSNTKTIRVPVLRDALSVYIFLHECAHFHLGHFYGGANPLPSHVQEFQAERTAISLVRTEGIRLPHVVIREAKRYVRKCVGEDRFRGLKIDKKVRRWCCSGELGDG